MAAGANAKLRAADAKVNVEATLIAARRPMRTSVLSEVEKPMAQRR
jgi:hypothetical protein